MDTGPDFLRSQVNNCIMQHRMLLEAIRDHIGQADDPAYSALCSHHLPHMERQHGMIEEYGKGIGADGGGAVKKAQLARYSGRRVMRSMRFVKPISCV